MKKLLCLVICFVLTIATLGVNQAKFVKYDFVFAQADETDIKGDIPELAVKSKAAYLVEANSGICIFKKNSTAHLPMASMTKMLSLKLIFQAIDSGKIRLDDYVVISADSAATGGSQAYLDENQKYRVEDLIKTVIIASANDSVVALSEAICGSEREFVKQMNREAKLMGLNNTHFVNSTGLPAPEHYSSAEDCAKIFQSIMNNATYNKYAKVWMDELVHPTGRKTGLVNTNRLVKSYPGCDAGKTGYTNDAGYCLTCSATKNGVRLIAVVMGEPDSKTRFSEVSELFNYGFSNYALKMVVDKNKYTTPVNISGAEGKAYMASPQENLYVFSKKGEEVKYTICVNAENLKAPLTKGSVIGTIKICDENDEVLAQTQLVINEDARSKTLVSGLIKIAENW